MKEMMKDNRTLVLSAFAGGLLLVIMSITYFSRDAEISALEEEYNTLSAEMTEVERERAERQAELRRQQTDAVVEATGLNPEYVSDDRDTARAFFTPAFDWDNAAEYNEARDGYIEALSDDSSFTAQYMPADTVIETDDGDLSYIDNQELQATMSSIYVVPLVAEGDNRIRYVGFVEYYMHKDDSDLANTDALNPSEAIIEFTVSGGDGDRVISEVDAWSGFSSGGIQ